MLELLLAVYVAVGLVVSVAAGVITARRARAKGRRVWMWGALGFLFGVFALAAVVLLPAPGKHPAD